LITQSVLSPLGDNLRTRLDSRITAGGSEEVPEPESSPKTKKWPQHLALRRCSHLKGYMLDDPTPLFGDDVPFNNPHLLLNEGEATNNL
jgi:hypothetical protein